MSHGFERFELLAAEVARAVPRGLGPGNGPRLPDSKSAPFSHGPENPSGLPSSAPRPSPWESLEAITLTTPPALVDTILSLQAQIQDLMAPRRHTRSPDCEGSPELEQAPCHWTAAANYSPRFWSSQRRKPGGKRGIPAILLFGRNKSVPPPPIPGSSPGTLLLRSLLTFSFLQGPSRALPRWMTLRERRLALSGEDVPSLQVRWNDW